jgi:hypothetical protein
MWSTSSRLVVDWKKVPACGMNDTEGPRVPLHILSKCTISGRDITPEKKDEFRERTKAEFPFVYATPKIK